MSKKTKEESHPTNWERTGTDTFNIHHDDGSTFECRVDDPKKFNAFKNKKNLSNGKYFGGIGEKKPLICDSCKQKVTRITYKDAKSLCNNCC